MVYGEIKSRDPKWAGVTVGQYAVVQLDTDGDVQLVYVVEKTKQEAVAFARALNLGSTAVLFRPNPTAVDKVPY